MATMLGEYCIRCGSLCVISPSEDGTQQVYTCPRGCGIQAVMDAPPPATQQAEAQPTEEDEKEEPINEDEEEQPA